MTTYLINHLRQPGIVNSEVLDYLDQVQSTLDPFGGKFIVQGGGWTSAQFGKKKATDKHRRNKSRTNAGSVSDTTVCS